MARLRDRRNGCPWDIEQTFATIAPYTIEEAYEVADAIERGDMAGLREELGDLLFQVVFHARMAEEAGLFDFHAVAADLADKMIRRHPHVFAATAVRDVATQTEAWEAQKAHERKAKDAGSGTLDGVPVGFPALMRAQKLQKRASRVGFDWGEAKLALEKVAEEVEELGAELASANAAAIEEELGDLLFAVVNVGRLAGADAEKALRGANAKFQRRFAEVERLLAERGKTPAQSDLAEMDALWQRAKEAERA
jgi:tetrapyrrole methylase family protein/MazG family protein/ATP diphosphatase